MKINLRRPVPAAVPGSNAGAPKLAGRFIGQRVSHKGLFIVGIALALELLLVGILTLLLIATDHEHASEASHRDKAMYSARLMFADVDAGVALVCAWRFRNMNALKDLDAAVQRADDAAAKVVVVNSASDDKWRTSSYQEDALNGQYRAVQLLRTMGKITSEGFTFVNLRKVWMVQQQLNGVLQNAFSTLQLWHKETAGIMDTNAKNLQMLMFLQGLVIVGGMVVQAIVAVVLGGYFTRHFIYSIESLRMNVDRMSQKLPLGPALSGKDEIAELDQSFRTMYDELAQASAREQALFDNACDVICVLDENLEIEKINSASNRLWGYPAQWISGSSISRLVPDNNWTSFRSVLEGSRFGEPAASFECDVRTQNGTIVRCLWSTFWSEQNRCWFCVIHDISEQHRLDQIREAFLSVIAHDLQQPLQRIYGLFEKLAACTSFSGFAQTKITNSLGTLKRLTALVGEILDFERLQSPESELDATENNLSETLAAAARDVESLAKAKNVTIEIECDSQIQGTFDQSKIVRVVVNLLSNAIKYSPDGTTIRVSGIVENKDLRISVIDHGPGIPAEAAQNLFKPFKQVNAADGKRGKGTGLGLVISKRLVELHQGRIGIESRVGEGSNFWFTVPAPVRASAADTNATGTAVDTLLHSSSTSGTLVAARKEDVSKKNGKGSSPVEQFGLKRVRLLLVGLPLAFEALFVAALAVLLMQGNAERALELRERDLVVSALNLCLGYLESTIAVLGVNGQPDRESFNKAMTSLPKRAVRLKNMSIYGDADTKEQVKTILSVSDRLEPVVKQIGQVLTTPEANSRGPLLNGAHDKLLIVCSRVGQPVIHFIEKRQTRERMSPEKQRSLRQQQATLLAGGLCLNVVLALCASVMFANSIARRLKIMAANAGKLSKDEELLPPVSGTDEIAQLDSSFHNMAARLKEQRKKESAYLDNSRDIIGTFDDNYEITRLNIAAESLWNTKIDGLLETSVLSLFADRDSLAFEEVLLSLKQTDDQVTKHLEANMLTHPAEYMLWSVSWSSTEQCYFFVAHDITKRKELERMKKEFIAVVSHDLRSPLATIFGTTELMVHGVFGEVADESRLVLQEVNVHVNQMLELINDLLDLEKLNAGQMQLVHTRIKLTELLDKAIDMIGPNLKEREQTVYVPHQEFELVVDVDRFVQAVANMLLELSLLVPPGSQLQIQSSMNDSSEMQLVLSAQESTLTLAEIALLRAKLENVHASAETTRSGSRLRLPLANTIIQAHQGTVTANITRTGQPAFYLTVPTTESILLVPSAQHAN